VQHGGDPDRGLRKAGEVWKKKVDLDLLDLQDAGDDLQSRVESQPDLQADEAARRGGDGEVQAAHPQARPERHLRRQQARVVGPVDDGRKLRNAGEARCLAAQRQYLERGIARADSERERQLDSTGPDAVEDFDGDTVPAGGASPLYDLRGDLHRGLRLTRPQLERLAHRACELEQRDRPAVRSGPETDGAFDGDPLGLSQEPFHRTEERLPGDAKVTAEEPRPAAESIRNEAFANTARWAVVGRKLSKLSDNR